MTQVEPAATNNISTVLSKTFVDKRLAENYALELPCLPLIKEWTSFI